jgi:hypothetical protein
MTHDIDPELYDDLVAVAADPGFAEWRAMVRSTGGCAAPVHLYGDSRTFHAATGELLASREPGRFLVACGNRRRTRCPSCAETYRADTFQLIKAGLVGGKDVPAAVASHPKVFATFTAPGFGPVHHRILGAEGVVESCHPHGSCRLRHRADDPDLGQPLHADTYDYVGAVLWNSLATRLWARTVQLVNRHAAHLLGISQRQWPDTGRVAVAKVAEYQARAVVHFHAIFRLDGPEREDPPPPGATCDLLGDAITHAAAAAHIRPPICEALNGQEPVCWGDQIDLRPVLNQTTAGRVLSDGQVAGYVAKYATKGAEASGTIDRPLACRRCRGTGRLHENEAVRRCDDCRGSGARESLGDLNLPAHVKTMITTCWDLGGLSELEHLRLRPWAHMLGFRGHFSTKSRRYSTTLAALRGARRQWRTEGMLAAHGLDPRTTVEQRAQVSLDDLGDDDDVVLVAGDWRYVGRGYTPGQAIYAATIAADIAESREIWRMVRRQEDQREGTP